MLSVVVRIYRDLKVSAKKGSSRLKGVDVIVASFTKDIYGIYGVYRLG